MKKDLRPGVLARLLIEEMGLHICPGLKHYLRLTNSNILVPISRDSICQELLLRMGSESTSALMNDAVYQVKYLAPVNYDSIGCSCKENPPGSICCPTPGGHIHVFWVNRWKKIK